VLAVIQGELYRINELLVLLALGSIDTNVLSLALIELL
jgi:hypothetical protein